MNLSVGCPRLSELDWWVLKVGEEVLRPLMLVMVELEGQKYVTTSFVIPMVEAIREGLNESNDLYMYTYRQIHYCHTSLTLVTQEVERYKEHACSNPIEMVGNPLGWWKQHGHHFPTLSRLACRFLSISTTSCPVERLFSVTGQVDAALRASVSPDTMTILVFLYETLQLVRKIRASRIVRTVLEH